MPHQSIRKVARYLGYELNRVNRVPPDFDEVHCDILEQVRPYTNTSPERIYGLIEAVRYVVRNNIPGSLMECGVFKGGSLMVMALTLLSEGIHDRELLGFDSFQGMPQPDDVDIDYRGKPAMLTFERLKRSSSSSDWVRETRQNVEHALAKTNYPRSRIRLIEGMVEETIPVYVPQSIALIRLDTDWYRSTRHELDHLYPRLASQGVLIVDDYGHFQGARRAVDEFLSEQDQAPFLNRLDYTGRLMIKP